MYLLFKISSWSIALPFLYLLYNLIRSKADKKLIPFAVLLCFSVAFEVVYNLLYSMRIDHSFLYKYYDIIEIFLVTLIFTTFYKKINYILAISAAVFTTVIIIIDGQTGDFYSSLVKLIVLAPTSMLLLVWLKNDLNCRYLYNYKAWITAAIFFYYASNTSYFLPETEVKWIMHSIVNISTNILFTFAMHFYRRYNVSSST